MLLVAAAATVGSGGDILVPPDSEGQIRASDSFDREVLAGPR